jgi:hypothetical protein
MKRAIDPTRDLTPSTEEPRIGARPAYEPPRIVKKRSVSRATLASSFDGCGPDGCAALGVTASG